MFEDPQGYEFIDGFDSQICAIKRDGMPECPGMDDALDRFLAGHPHLPIAGYVPRVPLTALSVGSAHAAVAPACGIREDNSQVVCWGTGAHPQPFPGMQFQQISVGSTVACGVLFSGELKCWDWFEADENTLERPEPGTFVQDISVTQYSVCAVLNDGRPRCWGAHVSDPHALGYDESTYRRANGRGWQSERSLTYLKHGIDNFEVDISELDGVDARNPSNYGCGITSSGGASCWQVEDPALDGNPGQLVTQPSPLASLFDSPLTQVAVTRFQACGLQEEGAISCWRWEE